MTETEMMIGGEEGTMIGEKKIEEDKILDPDREAIVDKEREIEIIKILKEVQVIIEIKSLEIK